MAPQVSLIGRSVQSRHQAPGLEAVTTATTRKFGGSARPETEGNGRRSHNPSNDVDPRSTPRTRQLLVTKKYVVSGDRGRGVDVSRGRAQMWVTTTGAVTEVAALAPRAEERRPEVTEEFNKSSGEECFKRNADI